MMGRWNLKSEFLETSFRRPVRHQLSQVPKLEQICRTSKTWTSVSAKLLRCEAKKFGISEDQCGKVGGVCLQPPQCSTCSFELLNWLTNPNKLGNRFSRGCWSPLPLVFNLSHHHWVFWSWPMALISRVHSSLLAGWWVMLEGIPHVARKHLRTPNGNQTGKFASVWLDFCVLGYSGLHWSWELTQPAPLLGVCGAKRVHAIVITVVAQGLVVMWIVFISLLVVRWADD